MTQDVAQRKPAFADEVTLSYSNSVKKLFGPLVARYANRPNGYVRIQRFGYNATGTDRAPKALLTLVDSPKDVIHNLAIRNIDHIQDQLRQIERQKYRIVSTELTDPVTSLPTTSIQLLPRHDLRPHQLGYLNAKEIRLQTLRHKYQKSLRSYPIARELESKLWRDGVIKQLESQRSALMTELQTQGKHKSDKELDRKKKRAESLGLLIESGGRVSVRVETPWKETLKRADTPLANPPVKRQHTSMDARTSKDGISNRDGRRKVLIKDEQALISTQEGSAAKQVPATTPQKSEGTVSGFFKRMGIDWSRWV